MFVVSQNSTAERSNMYNVNNDPRCLKSCNIVKRTLIEMLTVEQMPLDTISVSDIADRSGISRATFYRHFDTPKDVLIWASNDAVSHAVDSTPLYTANYKLFAYNFYEYWVHNSQFLEILVQAQIPEVFLVSLERYMAEIAPILFKESKLDKARQGYLEEVWAAVNWAILKRWVLCGEKESASELADIALHNLPEPA